VPVSQVGRPCPYHVLFGHDDDVNSLTVPSRHRQSSTPVCVAARKPQFWPGTLSRHRRNKRMVSVVAEKEFRIPNPKYTFPINAGRTGSRLSGLSGSFCCLSVLNDNGGLFRQTGAQRPRAGVSVGHTDVRHSRISAVGAHPSASGGVYGGSLCASLAAGRIGSSHPLLALILKNDDIEPLSKNKTLFTYSLLSGSCGEKEKGQTDNFTDLSNLAPQVGLEPTTP